MKKMWKKTVALLFIVGAFAMLFSMVAGAAPVYPKTQYYYLDEKGGTGRGELTVSGLGAKEKITKDSIKSSSTAVVKVGRLDQSLIWTEEGTFGRQPVSGVQYTNAYTIELNLAKAGTSKISFKVGNKTYTSTVRVLPYANPLSGLTITGVKNGTGTNLAGKFAKSSTAYVKVPKTQKEAQISMKAAAGWKITNICYLAEGKNRILTSEKGLNSAAIFVGRMPTGEAFRSVSITLRNTKNGAVLKCSCNIN